MTFKIAMLALAFGGACLITSASALPIVSVSGDTRAQQVRDDDAADVAGRVLRGLGGNSHRRYGDYDRRRYRDYNYGRRSHWDRGYDRHRD